MGFEPTPPRRLVPKTSALDRSATLPVWFQGVNINGGHGGSRDLASVSFPRCRILLTFGPKPDPSDPGPSFLLIYRPKFDPLPLSKIWHPPLSWSGCSWSPILFSHGQKGGTTVTHTHTEWGNTNTSNLAVQVQEGWCDPPVRRYNITCIQHHTP